MKAFLSVVLACCFVIPFIAQTATAGPRGKVAARQAHQHKRIHDGVKSGEVTHEEAARLHKGQREIREMKQDARRDGVVTQEEKQEITQKQNLESKKIFRARHNQRKRSE